MTQRRREGRAGIERALPQIFRKNNFICKNNNNNNNKGKF
jgi:hypothetical protein